VNYLNQTNEEFERLVLKCGSIPVCFDCDHICKPRIRRNTNSGRLKYIFDFVGDADLHNARFWSSECLETERKLRKYFFFYCDSCKKELDYNDVFWHRIEIRDEYLQCRIEC
jgi:hypothetical protein